VDGKSTTTDPTINVSDLIYAPPDFTNKAGESIIFVDFIDANYEIEFDVKAQEAVANSTIIFNSSKKGFPAISIHQQVISCQLDGENVQLQDQLAPDCQSKFKIAKKIMEPGTHELKITNTLSKLGPRTNPPVRWYSNPNRFHCILGMSDLRRDGGFLESYIPSNYEYDHFRMTFSVKILNSMVEHTIFTNGTMTEISPEEWVIKFPSFYTTSCPWINIGVKNEYISLDSEFHSTDGRILPISVYTTKHLAKSEVEIEIFRDEAISILNRLESDFGPFPHSSITIFATGLGKGGMEYAGATATNLGSLRHELDHSYFARSILPSNGDSGWMDEAIAMWGDANYPKSTKPPYSSSNLGNRSPYKRTTSYDSYSIGRDFLKYLDYILSDQGGLIKMLASYAVQKRHSSVSAKEFQSLVEVFHGSSLDDLFNKYVYEFAETRRLEATTEFPQKKNPHHTSTEEIFEKVFPNDNS